MNKKEPLSDLEKQKRKIMRKKIIRNVMTIPEIIIVIIVIIFIKNKYEEHGKNVHQVIEYQSSPYVYIMERTNDTIEVKKKNEDKIIEAAYEIKFPKKQMTILRGYFDATFKLKSGQKTVTMDKVVSDIGKKSIRSMIHNNPDFLKTSVYKNYELEDYEQNSDYHTRGYKITKDDNKHLIIALGTQESSGYLITVSEVHQKDDTLIFYVTTTEPSEKNHNTTYPMLKVSLEDNVNKVKVFEQDTGEEFKKYDDLET